MEKKVYSFTEYLNEVKKDYFEKMRKEDFEKIKKGDEVVYRGTTYTVLDSTGAVLKVEDEDGTRRTINYSMFNELGMIR